MHDKVLVDTSVWINFFRRKNPVLEERVAALLKSGKAVYAGIIALELIRGAKGRDELSVLYDAFDAMERAPETESTCLNAGRLGYEMARRGKTFSVVDLLIAQIAIENDFALMTADDDFRVIAENSELKLLDSKA